MVLVDTSVWIDVLRDSRGAKRDALARAVAEDEVVLTHFNQLELLQNCRDEGEWGLLKPYLDAQDHLEPSVLGWGEAARVYFDLRRRGRSVRSPIDCCIAQTAIEHDAMLLHRDRDFEAIAGIRPLRGPGATLPKIGVAMIPGSTMATRTPNGFISWASASLAASSARLATHHHS